MNFASGNIIKDINFGLALLTTAIKLDTHINLTDKAKIAEKIFGDIFTIIYKTKFTCADVISLKHPAIDLISNDTVFQISTDATPEKIRRTVETFIEKDYHKKYNKLKFLFISSRNPIGTNGNTNFGNLPLKIFNPKEDIYYSDRLSSQIQGLKDSELESIKNILWKELGLDYKKKRFKWIRELESELLSRTNKEGISNFEFENDLIYYTKQEEKIIDNFVKEIDFENKNTFLITGYPSTGKTTVAFDIAKRVQVDKYKGYYPFYIKIKANENLSFSDLFDDIEKIGFNPAILIIDDIHLNFPLANELLSRSQEYSNIIFLFVSRYITKELRKDLYTETDDIFEMLNDSRLSFEKFNSDDYYRQKLLGIIKKHKKHKQKNGYDLKIGNTLKIFDLTKKNLFKLRLILKDWHIDNDTLSEIDDNLLNQNLYSRFLNGLNTVDQKLLMIYASLYSFEISFSKSNEDDYSEKDGLFFTMDFNESLFMHSSFSDLLIDAYLFHNKTEFKQQYNSQKDRFVLSNIKEYISQQIAKPYCDFPDNIFQIFYNLGINKKKWIFIELQNDSNSFNALVNYFKNADTANSEELKNILQLTKIYAGRNYEKLVSKLIVENNRRTDILKKGESNLLTLSYAHYSIHPKNEKLKKSIYEAFSNDEFKEIILNANISKLTLAFKYLQDIKIRHRLVSILSKEQWVDIFNNIPFKFLGNSLTEIKTIDSELAFYIYNNLDEKYISSKIGKTHFDNITKTLSEINVLGNRKAKYILKNIPLEKLQKSINFVSVPQIGIGLSRLKKIDKSICQSIADSLNAELIYKKLIRSSLNDFGRVLVEIYNVSNVLAFQILSHIEEQNDLEERFNSSKIKGKEISHILESLYKIGDRKYGKHLLNTAHPDIIYGRILSSSIPISSHIIKSVGYFNKSLAEKYMDSYFKTNIEEKLKSKQILLTHLPNIFNGFSSVNFVKAQSLFSSLDNYLFVKKGLDRKVNLPSLANSFNVLKKYDRPKIVEIIKNLNSHNVFQSKIKECSIESLFSSVSILNKLSPNTTAIMINTYKEKISTDKKVSIQFSQFCDSLYRISKIDKELAQNILIDFKATLIKSYKNIGFRKLSSGLNTIGKIDIDYARELLRELPIEDLKKRIDNISNNKHNVNGALGEIRKVDEKIWKKLYEYANA